MERVLHLHLADDKPGFSLGSTTHLVSRPLYLLGLCPVTSRLQKLTPHEHRCLTQTTYYTESSYHGLLIAAMLLWIFVSKMVKIAPHFYDHPYDLLWLPAYLMFVYWHSLVKLYCALTFWNHSWGGRDLTKLKKVSVSNMDYSGLTGAARIELNMQQGVTDFHPEEPTRPSATQKA